MKLLQISIYALFAALCTALSVDAATIYHLTDIGVPPGGTNSVPFGINNSGQVVGWMDLIDTRAFIWTSADGMKDLGQLPGGLGQSRGRAINDNGIVVGESYTTDGFRPVAWPTVGGIHTLGAVPGGSTLGVAHGINNLGDAVGESFFGNGRAILWPNGGNPQELGDLPGGFVSSVASDINDSGQIVGTSIAATGDRAFLWTSGNGMLDIGDLPGGRNRSQAAAINSSGQIVGDSDTLNASGVEARHAFVWTSTSGMTDLGELAAFRNYRARAIDSSGQIVGEMYNAGTNNDTRAFLWTSTTGIQNLAASLDGSGTGWTLISAKGINDLGQIVGFGRSPGSSFLHAFVLTPVPEPSTIALAACGLALTPLARRWQARSRRSV